jgi:ubiquinone/menaquinone biosynthesis C-methylase UbiE
MDLLKEYINQNNWRDWERYLEKLPLNKDQVVYDLGCSIGAVSNLLAKKTKEVVGFDNNKFLLDEANKRKENNCEFVLDNIFTLEPSKLKKCDGIWMSFALAYMEDPELFISNWIKCLNYNGWFAIIDIDGLFSGHLPESNQYLDKIKKIEAESEQSKVYDFKIGRKIKSLMEKNGLKIITSEDNWYDVELNFIGKANKDIVQNWTARLERMVKLKDYFGVNYNEFCNDFLNLISCEEHVANGCVKFYVGIKNSDILPPRSK